MYDKILNTLLMVLVALVITFFAGGVWMLWSAILTGQVS